MVHRWVAPGRGQGGSWDRQAGRGCLLLAAPSPPRTVGRATLTRHQSTVWLTTVLSTYAGDSEDVIACGLLCVWQPGLQDHRMHFRHGSEGTWVGSLEVWVPTT